MLSMSPTQRQKEDAKRIQFRISKRGNNPGPAHYSPQRLASTSRELAGHFAFKSSSERIPSILLKDKGDPGEYDPHVYLSLAQSSSMSFNRASAEGKLLSGFGGQAERTLEFRSDVWNEGEKTPGPAAYVPLQDEQGKEWEMRILDGAETMKTASFASNSIRLGNFALPSWQNPGPGAYDPNDKATIQHLPGANPDSNLVSKVNRDSRFVGDSIIRESTTDSAVGPGLYESHVEGTIGKTVADTLSRSSQVQTSNKPGAGAIGFGSRYKQFELPHEDIAAMHSTTPGPGAYDIPHTVGIKEGAGAVSAFAPGKLDREIKLKNKGDPGAYNPIHVGDIAFQAAQSSQVACIALVACGFVCVHVHGSLLEE